ncbi:hypothetical protein VTL71DRAFT_7483 [Oculimacula yallundae]|uniref:Uncharacterized protein n=1 Tax=Oculimacula yallundae TaxID=86028 RepID=A0ABR4BU88_9HELO
MSSDTESFNNPLERCPKQVTTYPRLRFSQYNLREIWAEVEFHIYGHLRDGDHPNDIEREFNRTFEYEARKGNDDKDYRILFRATSYRVLGNLWKNGAFKELPSFEEYAMIVGHPVRKAVWGVMMFHRFEDFNSFRKSAMDPKMKDDMAKDPPLDETYLQFLHYLGNEITKEFREIYIERRKFLSETPDDGLWHITLEDPFVGGQYPIPRNIPSNQLVNVRHLYQPDYVQPTNVTWQPNEAGPRRPLGELIVVHSAKTLKSTAPPKPMCGLIDPSESTPSTIIMEKNLPNTPRNKRHEPKVIFGNHGHAFLHRPKDFGSPELPKHRRHQRSSIASGIEAVRVESVGLSLEAFCDAFDDESESDSVELVDGAMEFEQLPESALAFKELLDNSTTFGVKGSESVERERDFMGEVMTWASRLLKKYAAERKRAEDEQSEEDIVKGDVDEAAEARLE